MSSYRELCKIFEMTSSDYYNQICPLVEHTIKQTENVNKNLCADQLLPQLISTLTRKYGILGYSYSQLSEIQRKIKVFTKVFEEQTDSTIGEKNYYVVSWLGALISLIADEMKPRVLLEKYIKIRSAYPGVSPYEVKPCDIDNIDNIDNVDPKDFLLKILLEILAFELTDAIHSLEVCGYHNEKKSLGTMIEQNNQLLLIIGAMPTNDRKDTITAVFATLITLKDCIEHNAPNGMFYKLIYAINYVTQAIVSYYYFGDFNKLAKHKDNLSEKIGDLEALLVEQERENKEKITYTEETVILTV
jgi:hypothetical protein